MNSNGDSRSSSPAVVVSGVPLPSLNRMILPPTGIFPIVVRWPNNYMDQYEIYKNINEIVIFFKWSKMSIPWPRQHASAMYSPAAIGEGPEGNINSVKYRYFVLVSKQNWIWKMLNFWSHLGVNYDLRFLLPSASRTLSYSFVICSTTSVCVPNVAIPMFSLIPNATDMVDIPLR